MRVNPLFWQWYMIDEATGLGVSPTTPARRPSRLAIMMLQSAHAMLFETHPCV